MADFYPKFHITAITHCKDAVYNATIVGIPPQEDAWIGKATERIFLAPIKMTMVPEIVDMVLPVEGVFHNLVIVKINKTYPGQAIKVMNSMWGAGQMMFTKMMVVVDGDVNIHNNWEVAACIAAHTDVARDIIFTQGPNDVLDHSCSTMAFGGKMGIDATIKLKEEMQGLVNIGELSQKVEEIVNGIKNAVLDFEEIKQLNTKLLEMDIPLLFMAVEKNRTNHIKELAAQLVQNTAFRKIKMIIFLEPTFDISDIADAVWRFSNNIDPRRDHYLIAANSDDEFNHIVFDGTRKTKIFDGFERDWPNILAADEATMDRIDVIWPKLGLGAFIKSPSRKYIQQLYGTNAVAE